MKGVKKVTVTQFDLAAMVAQASSLSECLSSPSFEVDSLKIDKQQVSKRLEHWCQLAAKGNWEKFQKRLEWDDLDIETLYLRLEKRCLTDNQALPDWAKTLQEIIQMAANLGSQYRNPMGLKSCLDPQNPLLFEDVLLPALLVARQKLIDRLEISLLSHIFRELLCEEAFLDLERGLLQRLVNLCAKTLESEFFLFRPLGHSLLNLLVGDLQGSKSQIYYNAFVQKLLQDGLLTFFQKYAVLAKLVAITVDFYIEATAEFLQRLNADLPEIQQVFVANDLGCGTSSGELGKISKIEPFLSDFHNQGRSVIAFSFESGLKLVYKPKDLGVEVAWNQLLAWCNQRSILLPFKILKVFNQRNYGWVEYVEQQPCESEEAAQRFYLRVGMLLCLVYVLGGTDCHYENLIASGEHLVIVDLETLMHHIPKADKETEISSINQKFWDSVLRTGFLPRWDLSNNHRVAYDVSGVGSINQQQVARSVPQWKAVNTDDIHLAYQTVQMPVQKNVPLLNGHPLSVNDYLNEFISGFEQMYRFLINNRKALVGNGKLLETFQGQLLRFVFRVTRVYSTVLRNSLVPEYLQTGIDHSIALEILSQALLISPEKPQNWSILQAELKAMEQLDIPYFGAFSNNDTLSIGLKSPIEEYFKEPSYNQVLKRMQRLDEADLARQVAIIRGAVYAGMARKPGSKNSTSRDDRLEYGISYEEIQPLTLEQLLQQAEAIAHEINRTAIRSPSGSANWIGLGYMVNAERFQLQILGESIYDGNCGIALFLAALAHITGKNQFRELALAALQPLRQLLHTSSPDLTHRFARFVGIGGATGMGSIIYALVKISQFLQEAILLEEAQQFANLLTLELITADRQFDLIGGTAGAILGLLTLYADIGEQTILEKAMFCGQHLLKHSQSVNNAPKAWRNLGEKPLTGFAHGVAGIILALLRLYAATQNRDYLNAACEGIAYEQSTFSLTAANWPDFRFFAEQSIQPEFVTSWCHGAPGIGLARLGGLSIWQTEEICREIEVALQTTQKFSLQGIDNLCCGNFGRLEVLLVAAQKLSKPQLQETVQKRAACLVARAEKTGTYQLFANLPHSLSSPSFFLGTAGIGYELLRLAYPETVPSVLLWE